MEVQCEIWWNYHARLFHIELCWNNKFGYRPNGSGKPQWTDPAAVYRAQNCAQLCLTTVFPRPSHKTHQNSMKHHLKIIFFERKSQNFFLFCLHRKFLLLFKLSLSFFVNSLLKFWFQISYLEKKFLFSDFFSISPKAANFLTHKELPIKRGRRRKKKEEIRLRIALNEK